MDEKERKARELADQLLDDGGDTWPAKDIFAFVAGEGWLWDGHDWTQRTERNTNAMTTEAELLLAIRLRDGGAAIYDLIYLASHHTIHPAYGRIAFRMNTEGWATRPGTDVVAEAARRFAAEQAKRTAQEAQP